ncbi:MAG: winged helix-turn-helix transcriptional regulator [Candidatus Hydrogenedentes bacterium]|nr:winged helix-turn-helix transcriptional regulator [Candidatus Hydrogenedentota bacterium]
MRIFEYNFFVKNQSLKEFKAGIFQALAHPTRVAIAEILRDGELSAGAILEQLGLEQANVSQHLAVMRAKGVVSNRKEGNQVFYSLRHPMLVDVLNIMRQYFLQQLSEASEMLQAIEVEEEHSPQV